MDPIAQQKNEPKGGVYALGNFDGVHRGHKAVIRRALDEASAKGMAAHVLTFEPHPRTVLQPGAPPFRLTPAPVKEKLLHKLGVGDVIVLPFTIEFSNLSAEDFAQKILVERFAAQHIIAGADFVFGHDRAGTMPLLRQWLAPHGIAVTEVSPLRDESGRSFSSSRAREALRQGDPKAAAHILGRNWSIGGIIEHGAKRGSSIGIPTANIALGNYLRPKFGVYAVIAHRAKDGSIRKGVANIGTRPTVDGTTEMLEAHLFDFNQVIYGEEWKFELVDFIRPEQKFDSLAALKAQIEKDVEAAKADRL